MSTNLILLDDCDLHLLSSYTIRVAAKGYAIAYNSSTQEAIYLHRLIMNPPAGLEVDHINGNRLDNRRTNLRICTKSENMRNAVRPKESKHGLPKGVYLTKSRRNPYEVKFKYNTLTVRVGNFDSVEKAEKAYLRAIELFHGQFAYHTSRGEK